MRMKQYVICHMMPSVNTVWLKYSVNKQGGTDAWY